VSFGGFGSDYEGDALTYTWDFDYQGGTFTQDATGQNVSHTYATAGTYTVVLKVTDSNGAWNMDSLTVTVNASVSSGTISWAGKTDMTTGRYGLAVGVVNNKIYAIGGHISGGIVLNTVEEYNPSTNTWTNCGSTCASMPTARTYLAVGVVNNKIYAIGGNPGSFPYLSTVEEYDPATNAWTTKASMLTARQAFAAGVVNNKIYAIGGCNVSGCSTPFLSTVEEYDPATNTWATKASMPTGRIYLAVGVVNNKIYAIGGCADSSCSTYFSTVEEYDPATNTWTNCGSTCSSMTTARGYLAAGVVNNRIYAIGGNINSGNTSLATVEEYDPATNTWANCGSTCLSMPTARGSLAVGVVSNKIYAIGSLTTVEEGTLSGSLPTWNNPPTANAGADRSATVGVSESFTGSASDQEGDSLSYAWDFNYQNGQFTIDSTLQNPTYTYTATGTYAVVLRVTDSKGAWNQDSMVVTVNVVVSTLAGSGTAGFADGTGTAAQFNYPHGVAVDSSGNVYVADEYNHRIRKITAAGVVSTLAGSGVAGFADGTGTEAQFYRPNGVAVDSSGNVYVGDHLNHRIRKITAAGDVSTLAGSGVAGFADGTGITAQFNYPGHLALDSSGNIYVADHFNHRVRKITPAGVVSTLAGSGAAGFADGTGTAAQFNYPFGVAVDSSGNVYVTDHSGHRIRKITPVGVVSTLAGSGVAGFADGTGTDAQFYNPYEVDVDSSGNVYVADTTNYRIRKITTAGVVSTLAGSGVAGFADGMGADSQFNNPIGIALDSSGNLYVGDGNNHRIRKIAP
jgi:PKD repeat protein